MADRFPLILDTAGTNQIKELPNGDNLNLQNGTIVNVANIDLTGNLTANNGTFGGDITGNRLEVTTSVTGTNIFALGNFVGFGNANITGTVDAANFTVDGEALSSIQVQSDWNEADTGSAAFIRNKPDISGVQSIYDLNDVVGDALPQTEGHVLTLDGAGHYYPAAPDGGIALTDFSVTQNPKSGQGSLTYDDGTGEFTYTPPNAVQVGGNISDLINDSNYTTLAAVTSDGFIKLTSLSGGSGISYNNLTGEIAFDNGVLNFITIADAKAGVSLDDVTNVNGTTINNISVGGLTLTGAGPHDLSSIDVLNIGMSGNLTSTNGNISTTNGSVSGATGTLGGMTFNNQVVSVASGGIEINAPGKVDISNNSSWIGLPYNISLPSTGTATGDFAFIGDTAAILVQNMSGVGTADEWLYLGGTNAPRGLVIPRLTSTQRNAITNPYVGELIINVSTNKVQLYYGGSWIDLN